jgi:hypothetical protein
MTITIKDENHLPEIIEQINQLSKYKVSAGVPSDGDVGMIAAVMEYGATIVPRPERFEKNKGYLWIPDKENGGFVLLKSVTIPSRSYIRSTFTEKQADWQAFAEKLVWQVATGDLTAYQAYNQLGARLARDIQQKIKSHPSPANAPLTSGNKSGGGTLIDTGRLWQSVTWKVEGI